MADLATTKLKSRRLNTFLKFVLCIALWSINAKIRAEPEKAELFGEAGFVINNTSFKLSRNTSFLARRTNVYLIILCSEVRKGGGLDANTMTSLQIRQQSSKLFF